MIVNFLTIVLFVTFTWSVIAICFGGKPNDRT